jgi:cell division protein FtsI (penicillin-binding protein 3)
VTPVQLVTMVSTIANGGVYMPPHVLLQSTDEMKGDARLQPAAFHPENQLPEKLPDGAHRVISEMTAAKMRMMMEGIVTEGTGKEAALNGYSAGGKTGTAQKIDVATHTYSIDSPKGPSFYGGAVSAPVFAQIAQQTLEYLGVPYDREVKATKMKPLPRPMEIAEDSMGDHVGDQAALFAGINDLPKDDPLRNVAESKPAPVAPDTANASSGPALPVGTAVASVNTSALPRTANSAGMIIVPQLIGKPLREAMETLMAQGLQLHAAGSGVARSQSPSAGTPLQPGAQVLVRFAH